MGFRLINPKRIQKVKSQSSREVLQKLQDFLDESCNKPVEILCGFWKDQQNAITYRELRQAVMDGTINRETLKLWQQDYSVLAAKQFGTVWEDAMKAGAVNQPVLSEKGFVFNTQTHGIKNWIQNRGAAFVTSCTEEQKAAVSALLSKKMVEGHTVDELARMIRPCIGLTEGQAKANARYYDSIVANLKKEHPRMKPENIQKKAQDAAAKYAERQHRQRAMTIAQTESAFAYNRGADEGIRQAQAQGFLGRMMKRWSTSGDDAVCSICQGLEGVELGMDEEFAFKGRQLFAGQNLMPPAHPRCACAVEYIEVEQPKFEEMLQNETAEIAANETDEGIRDMEHDAPQYLGSLDDTSDGMVKSMLEKYEEEIVNSDIENAVVITDSGLVWHCYGNKNNVYPTIDLGDKLIGASVTHNHPIGSANEYSFSKRDIDLFMEYKLKALRGIDELYIYELTRSASEIDEPCSIFELTEFDGRHESVIFEAKQLGIGYRRWKR